MSLFRFGNFEIRVTKICSFAGPIGAKLLQLTVQSSFRHQPRLSTNVIGMAKSSREITETVFFLTSGQIQGSPAKLEHQPPSLRGSFGAGLTFCCLGAISRRLDQTVPASFGRRQKIAALRRRTTRSRFGLVLSTRIAAGSPVSYTHLTLPTICSV